MEKVEPIIWARPQRRARGPQPAHDLDRIARAAITVADSEGIEALTMRRLATELGTGTMSLYRYVSGKEDVHDLMVDTSLGEIELLKHDDWRSGLRWLGNSTRRHVHRHPWLAAMLGTGPRFGPHGLKMTEHVLGIVDGLGLNIDEMMSAIGMVNAYVHGFVQQEMSAEERLRKVGMTMAEWQHLHGPYIKAILDGGEYPLFNRLIIEAAQPHMTPDESFAYGLDRVLDGVAAGLLRPPPRS